MAIEAISDSELLGCAYYCGMGAITDEDTRLTGCYEEGAVFALI